MPYPAALGHRPLEVDEAYAALTQYAADYGREPLLLLMHAAVPETLRPDLLNLIRVNFLAARGPDTSLEADVLFSPLATALGGGYYRIDAQVRWHCLVMLRSLYRHDPRPRIRRIAELLWRYVEAREHQASRAADPQLAEFLDIQRWVALAFLEPGSAAHAFADALRQAGDSRGSVALRLGGLAAAIEIPLAGQPELLAYARGLDALAGGNDEAGRQLLEALGDGEIRVGDIVLRPGDLLDSPVHASLQPLHPRSPRPARVFISYPQTYTPYVRPLVAALKGLGLEVSWDMDLSSGHDWATALSRMLEDADAVICVAGRDTAAREFPMAEIQRSVELGKRLIPVLVEPIDAPPALTERIAANPERSGRLRYLLDGWRENDFDALVAEVAERIRTRLSTPEQAQESEAAPDGPATRQLSIRVTQAGQLDIQCADENGRHDWRQAYDPAAVALVADTFQHQTPRTGQALDVLADLLIPSPLAGLPPASAYRLILGPEAVPWPWELMLSRHLHALRKAIPVLRRSDGNLFSVLREPPRRALLVHSRPQSEAPIRTSGLDALQSAGFEVTIITGEPRETLLALTSGDFGLVIISGRSSAGDGRAGMLLGDGVALGSEDLAQMRLTPEVIILHDPDVDHGGLASLMAPALQQAGVRCVVAPAWGAGGPADAAYHNTLLSLLAGGERFADAHAGAVAACFEAAPQDGQWAAYQAWGEPDFRFPGLAPA